MRKFFRTFSGIAVLCIALLTFSHNNQAPLQYEEVHHHVSRFKEPDEIVHSIEFKNT